MSEATKLHDAIMNLPCEHLMYGETPQYKVGHKDARHAAAELAVEAMGRLEAELKSKIAELFNAVEDEIALELADIRREIATCLTADNPDTITTSELIALANHRTRQFAAAEAENARLREQLAAVTQQVSEMQGLAMALRHLVRQRSDLLSGADVCDILDKLTGDKELAAVTLASGTGGR